MSKPVKDMITADLRNRYGQTDSALWIDLIGADGVTTNHFRRELREKGMRLEIVRNSLFRRACRDGPLSPLAAGMNGPAALVTGGDSLIDVAKLVEQWFPRIKSMKLRGAVIEGEFLDESAVGGLAKMPTKRDLQAGIAASALAPGANIASAALAGGRNIAGCVKTLFENLEKAETAAAA